MKTTAMTLMAMIFALVMPYGGYAQFSREEFCGTTEHLKNLKTLDPTLEGRMIKMEAETQACIKLHKPELIGTKTVVTIPVVVHILYNTPDQNIADERVYEQIAILNQDYRAATVHGSMGGFPLSLMADCEVEFCLAKVDPAGNPTSGIERRWTYWNAYPMTNVMKDYSKGGLNAWDPQNYFNIWVCNTNIGYVSFAQYPTPPLDNNYGVVVHYKVFGLSGLTMYNNMGAVSTHEIGHCLNLIHIWGDDGLDCTGTDYCDDTPNQAGSNGGCPANAVISCNNGPLGDMYMNFMDYTVDACKKNFTPDQKARMQSLFVPGGALVNLKNSTKCTLNPPLLACDPPLGRYTVVLGPNSAELNWSGLPTGNTYVVQYRKGTTGNFIQVAVPTGHNLLLTGLLASTSYQWKVRTACSTTFSALETFTTNSVNCVDIYETNNTRTKAATIPANGWVYGTISGTKDVDWYYFSNSSYYTYFRVALTSLPANYNIDLYNAAGQLLATSQNTGLTDESIIYNTSSFAYYYVKVYPASSAYNANVCYTLRIYLSVNPISKDVLVEEPASLSKGLLLFPNPTTGLLNLEYSSPESGSMQVTIGDMTGRIVYSEAVMMSTGLNQKQLQLDRLSPGLYFIELRGMGEAVRQKILLE